MKNALGEEFVKVSRLIQRYFKLEVEYIKLTFAEKVSMLVSALTVGVFILVLTSFTVFMLAFSCAELFKMIMPPTLAYLSTAGVFLIILSIVMIFKEKWIINPISRFLTRILFDKEDDN